MKKNLPGYDRVQRKQIKDKRMQQVAKDNEYRKMIKMNVRRSALAEMVGATTGLLGAPVAFLWLTRNYDINGGLLSLLVTLWGRGGSACGLFGVKKLNKSCGYRLIKKIDDGKQLNILQQRQLGRRFSDESIREISHFNEDLLRALYMDKLPHIPYNTACAIIEGGLDRNPSEYLKVASVFNEDSLPKHIIDRFGRQR